MHIFVHTFVNSQNYFILFVILSNFDFDTLFTDYFDKNKMSHEQAYKALNGMRPTISVTDSHYYNRTSVARTQMARSPRLFRTLKSLTKIIS